MTVNDRRKRSVIWSLAALKFEGVRPEQQIRSKVCPFEWENQCIEKSPNNIPDITVLLGRTVDVGNYDGSGSTWFSPRGTRKVGTETGRTCHFLR